MTDANLKYEVVHGLNSIMEKSKAHPVSHHSKQVIYYILEYFSYLIFFGLIGIAFYLSDYLTFELNPFLDIDVLVSLPEWRLLILLLRIFLLFLSLFPLGVGLLIRSSRRKSGKMYEVNKLAGGLISRIVAKGND